MKKIIIKENDLINIIKRVINENEDFVYTIVGFHNKTPNKRYVWGEYKDGSTLFIPYGEHSKFNSKIKYFNTFELAKKKITLLRNQNPNLILRVEPLKKIK